MNTLFQDLLAFNAPMQSLSQIWQMKEEFALWAVDRFKYMWPWPLTPRSDQWSETFVVNNTPEAIISLNMYTLHKNNERRVYVTRRDARPVLRTIGSIDSFCVSFCPPVMLHCDLELDLKPHFYSKRVRSISPTLFEAGFKKGDVH